MNIKFSSYYIALFLCIILCFYIIYFPISSVMQKDLKILDYIFNEHGQTWVYEDGNKRCLAFTDPFLQKPNCQSCILLNDIDQIVFEYQRSIMGAFFFRPDPKKILLIGLGGGTIVNAILSIVPDATINIVEINEAMPKIAIQYFFMKQNKNTKIFIEDGAQFINNKFTALHDKYVSVEKYDFIILDAFNKDYIPQSFLELEFVQKIKSLMNESSVLAVNTFKSSPSYNKETMLYKKVFHSFFDLIGKNRVMLINNIKNLTYDDIVLNSLQFKKKFRKLGIDTDMLLQKFQINID